MFEDVFEPFDDIIDGGDAQEASDEWGEVWDTGEKEDMWRADSKDVWSVAPANQPVVTPAPIPAPRNQPKPDPIVPTPGPMSNNTPIPENDQCGECDTECEKESCPEECEKESCPEECDQGCAKDSGLFDDLFLDIF